MKLKKAMGLLDVFCLAVGAMLGSLFVLPGLAYEMAGPAMLFSYLLAGLMALLGQFSQLELASAMPKAGGAYFYITRSMGDAVGTVYGLITWLSLVLKSTYELAFMTALLLMTLQLNAALLPVAALLICGAILLLNLLGLRESEHIQVTLFLAVMAILLFYCLQTGLHVKATHFEPFAPFGLNAILPTAGFVFVSFGAILKITGIAEEIKEPGKTIPKAMVLALSTVYLIYVIVVFTTIGYFGGDPGQSALTGSRNPLADAMSGLIGRPGWLLLNLAAIITILSSVYTGVMSASRYPLALARDEMLPAALARVNRHHTPHFSLLLTGAVMAIALLVDIKMLVKAASAVLIMTYILTCLAVIVLRESHVQNYRPQYHSPAYPWLQIITMLGLILFLIELGIKPFLTSCVLMALGFGVYWIYGRAHTGREYALLHVIERLTDRQLTDHHLETELKDIIHERDEVLKDRFDHLVETCQVLDLDGNLARDDFFCQAALALSPQLQMETDAICNLLRLREQESPTTLTPFMAIPHIVIPGGGHFNMIMVRCRDGIHFSGAAPRVHTVFILMGTRDERLFHLQALAAICQIVQDESFEPRWLKAKDPAALRDILLLSQRRRIT